MTAFSPVVPETTRQIRFPMRTLHRPETALRIRFRKHILSVVPEMARVAATLSRHPGIRASEYPGSRHVPAPPWVPASRGSGFWLRQPRNDGREEPLERWGKLRMIVRTFHNGDSAGCLMEARTCFEKNYRQPNQ